MNVTFHFDFAGEPPGKIRLSRLITFAQRFNSATLRSAQAELSVPAFRKQLGAEPRPEFRLTAFGAGSVSLTLESVSEREIDRVCVVRHLEAIHSYKQRRQWPPGVYRGELEAWADFYGAALQGTSQGSVAVSTEGTSTIIDQPTLEELRAAVPQVTYRHIQCVGDLHMIEVLPDKHPRFRIDSDQVDLIFDLTPEVRNIVDEFRWQRVRAEGLWEEGTARAQLTGALQPTSDPPGVIILDNTVRAISRWISEQTSRVAGFIETRPGWDGPGSLATSRQRIESANELLSRLDAQFGRQIEVLGPPVAFPTPDGSISFEWQVNQRFVYFELVAGGYELLVTESDAALFEGVAGQRPLFQWIAWLLDLAGRPE